MPVIEVYGVILPGFGVLALVSYCLFAVLRRLLARTGFYGHVWHVPFFDFAFYICLLGVIVLFVEHPL